MRSLSEGSDSGPLTLADIENFLDACRALGMDPEQTTMHGDLSGVKSRMSLSGPLTTITAHHAGQAVVASPGAPPDETIPLTVGPPSGASGPLVPGLSPVQPPPP